VGATTLCLSSHFIPNGNLFPFVGVSIELAARRRKTGWNGPPRIFFAAFRKAQRSLDAPFMLFYLGLNYSPASPSSPRCEIRFHKTIAKRSFRHDVFSKITYRLMSPELRLPFSLSTCASLL
jgi:hypothetical protein